MEYTAPRRPVLPRWVEDRNGDLAILIRVAGTAALIRFPDRRGGYAWRTVAELTRRRDLDCSPDPEWLAAARVSRRPSSELYWLLGRTPPPPDVFPPVPAPDPESPPAPMFEVAADGRPLSDDEVSHERHGTEHEP